MILAILEDDSSAQTLLNNLSEADFDLQNISIITQDGELGKTLEADGGPLKGVRPKSVVDALARAGISGEDAKLCAEAVTHGKILLAMNTADEYRRAAEEILKDHSAKLVKG